MRETEAIIRGGAGDRVKAASGDGELPIGEEECRHYTCDCILVSNRIREETCLHDLWFPPLKPPVMGRCLLFDNRYTMIHSETFMNL